MKQLLIISLVVWTSMNGFAQNNHLNYTWKFTPEENLSDKEAKMADQLSKLRFRAKGTSGGQIILQVKNINGLKRFLKSKKDTLILNDLDVATSTISTLVYGQFTEKFPDQKLNKFKRYMRKARKSSRYGSDVWEFELDLPAREDFAIVFYRKERPVGRVRFEYLSTTMPDYLLQVDRSDCKPIDRRTYFLNIQPEIPELTTRTYRPKSRDRYRKTFTLYFQKNESHVAGKKLQEIIDYLRDSNLVINKAAIEAFASVEGDYTNNQKLQKQRAEILVALLEKVNKGPIDAEITTAENWELFRKQLRNDPEFQVLEDSVIKTLLYDEATLEKYEPFLTEQRTARLHLTLSRRLTREEKLHVMIRDNTINLNRYYVKRSKEIPKGKAYDPYKMRYIKKYVAIRAYARQLIRRGVYSPDDFTDLSSAGGELFLADYHRVMKEMREGKDAVSQTYQEYHEKALKITRRQLQGSTFQWSNPALIHAGKVQANIFEGLMHGRLTADILDEMRYPDQPGFYHLIMNKMDFLKGEGEKFASEITTKHETKVLPEKLSKQWFEHSEITRYYYFVKKLIINEDKEINKLVASRTDRMMHWDLFEFLWFNIISWDPETGYLYDREVTPDIMRVYLRKLWKLDTNICPDDLYQLRLTYELKRLKAAVVSGSRKKDDQDAYGFVYNYYKSRKSRTPGDVASAVGSTMARLNAFEFNNAKAKDAAVYLGWFYEKGLLDETGANLYLELWKRLNK